MSTDIQNVRDRRNYMGFLTLANLDAVADRIRAMIGEGQRYTFVACYEFLEFAPEVRTGQIAKKIEVWRKSTDGRPRGEIIVDDSYGTWWLNTAAVNRDDAHARCDTEKIPWFHFKDDEVRIKWRHPGESVYWVIAMEKPNGDGGA